MNRRTTNKSPGATIGRKFVFIILCGQKRTLALRACVLTATVNADDEPLTVTGLGEIKQVALTGAPAQVIWTCPENPLLPARVRL